MIIPQTKYEKRNILFEKRNKPEKINLKKATVDQQRILFEKKFFKKVIAKKFMNRGHAGLNRGYLDLQSNAQN